MTPLVSIIIPTANRPQFLPRAVESALAGLTPGEVEVIVVPNGPDQSWRRSLNQFSCSVGLRVLPIGPLNANAARNAGLRAARGQIIRFLDDDDYFYRDALAVQCHLLEMSGGDVCSGQIDLFDTDQRKLGTTPIPLATDFISAVLSAERLPLHAHAFRRAVISGTLWDEKLPYGQDIDWMLRLCLGKDLSWVVCEKSVGVWSRHTGSRISKNAPFGAKKRSLANILLEFYSALESQGRMNEDRRQALASGLWILVHDALYTNPVFYTHLAILARQLAPESVPPIPLYANPLVRHVGLHPLVYEWIMAPKRLVSFLLRRAMVTTGLKRNW